MSMKWPGGLIRKTPVTPTVSSAPGMWTLAEASYWTKQGLWPSPPILDPFFSSVPLLLPGNGTNGAQNNTFLDSSTNNFTITRNGNTTQGSVSPFALNGATYNSAVNGGSGYFDGNGDFLQTPQSTNLAANSTDYTVEGWFYFDAATYSAFDSAGRGIVSDFLANANGRWSVGIDNSGRLEFAEQDALGANPATATDPTPITTRQWIYFAAVKSGTTMRLFKNGTQVATTTSAVRTAFGGRLNIGQATPDTNYRGFFLGNISNVRFVKGSALYSSNFTAPTAPVTAVTNTQLLCNFTNAGIVDSAAKTNLETVGNAQISIAQSKFGGSSMLFDGTADALAGYNNQSLILGSSNFTWECWVYLNSIVGTQAILSQRGAQQSQLFLGVDTASGGQIFAYADGVGSPGRMCSVSMPTGQWVHIALVRVGTTVTLYKNGVGGTTATSSQNFISQNVFVGSDDATGGGALNGYIDDLRITNGIARYTSNFTPPTAAFPTS